MAAPQSPQQGTLLLNKQVIMLAAALLLPGLAPSLFGWVSGLLATPVFCFLCLNGQRKGTLIIRNSILLAAVAALVLNLLPSLLFSLTLVPLGYSFSTSYSRNNNEIQAGMRGVFVLAVSWLIFWSVYGTFQNIKPYQQLLEVLDTGFAQTYEYYRNSSEIPAESILQLELAINVLRRIIPTILPGILCCTVLITVWINLLFSASLIARLQPEKTPWKKYSQWRLPDKLVWILIAGGIILMFGHEQTSQVGIGIFFTTALLYFFQGLAVFVYMLDKWNIPVYLRAIIYIILILQSYGLILLILAGLADVWLDFRRMQPTDNLNGN